MTRATVGGINQEDNLWYPLAVNAQGIAQIDTSGIPQPMEWITTVFTPYFASTDESGTAIIEYERQRGYLYKLGNMCFVKVHMQTESVVITNPRGNLIVAGFPYTWLNNSSRASSAGLSIGQGVFFKENKPILGGYISGKNLAVSFRYLVDGTMNQMPFSALAETDVSGSNSLLMSFWGEIESTDDPPVFRFRDGILQETGEIPTGTP